jgi:hypothetical protein
MISILGNFENSCDILKSDVMAKILKTLLNVPTLRKIRYKIVALPLKQFFLTIPGLGSSLLFGYECIYMCKQEVVKRNVSISLQTTTFCKFVLKCYYIEKLSVKGSKGLRLNRRTQARARHEFGTIKHTMYAQKLECYIPICTYSRYILYSISQVQVGGYSKSFNFKII